MRSRRRRSRTFGRWQAGLLAGVLATVTGVTVPVVFSSTASAATVSITGVSPSSGPVAGGTVVTLTGTGFDSSSVVGGRLQFFEPGTNQLLAYRDGYRVISKTEISFVTPAIRPGAVTMGFGNTYDGTDSTVTYTAIPSKPTVTSVSPASATPSGGTVVRIDGANLTGATITVDGVTVPKQQLSPDRDSGTPGPHVNGFRDFTTSPHAAGTVELKVSNPAGTAVSRLTFAPQPLGPLTVGAVTVGDRRVTVQLDYPAFTPDAIGIRAFISTTERGKYVTYPELVPFPRGDYFLGWKSVDGQAVFADTGLGNNNLKWFRFAVVDKFGQVGPLTAAVSGRPNGVVKPVVVLEEGCGPGFTSNLDAPKLLSPDIASVYVVRGRALSPRDDDICFVEPGTILKFDDPASIGSDEKGLLVLAGYAKAPVVLTSTADTTVGPGYVDSSQSGVWKGIDITGGNWWSEWTRARSVGHVKTDYVGGGGLAGVTVTMKHTDIAMG